MAKSFAKEQYQRLVGYAKVTINNQDTVILTRSVPEQELICLLHDNRIYAFSREDKNKNSQSCFNIITRASKCGKHKWPVYYQHCIARAKIDDHKRPW